MHFHELLFDKATDNKRRWAARIGGTEFKLYIPEASVPDPAPRVLRVALSRTAFTNDSFLPRLTAALEFVEEHTETVQYKPTGDPKTWRIGQPYIPKALLVQPWPDLMLIGITWG